MIRNSLSSIGRILTGKYESTETQQAKKQARAESAASKRSQGAVASTDPENKSLLNRQVAVKLGRVERYESKLYARRSDTIDKALEQRAESKQATMEKLQTVGLKLGDPNIYTLYKACMSDRHAPKNKTREQYFSDKLRQCLDDGNSDKEYTISQMQAYIRIVTIHTK